MAKFTPFLALGTLVALMVVYAGRGVDGLQPHQVKATHKGFNSKCFNNVAWPTAGRGNAAARDLVSNCMNRATGSSANMAVYMGSVRSCIMRLPASTPREAGTVAIRMTAAYLNCLHKSVLNDKPGRPQPGLRRGPAAPAHVPKPPGRSG